MEETKSNDTSNKQLFIVGINDELTELKIQFVIEYEGIPEINPNSIKVNVKSRYEIIDDRINLINDDDEKDVSGDKVLFIFYPLEDANLYVTDGEVMINKNSINSTKKILEKQADDIIPIRFDSKITDMNEVATNLNKLKEIISKKSYQRKNVSNNSQINVNENDQNQTYIDILTLFIQSVNEMLNIPIMKKFMSLETKSRKSALDKNSNINELLEDILTVKTDFSRFTSESNEIHSKIMNILFEGSSESRIEINIIKYPSDVVENNKFQLLKEKEYSIPLSSFANNFLYNLKEKGKDYHDKLKSKIKNGYPMYINFVIGLISENINKINDSINNILTYLMIPTVQTKINQEVRKKMKTQILTFLKIRNDEHNIKIYNRRFNVSLGGTSEDINSKLPKQMLLGYNDDNEEYYKSTDGQLIPTNTVPDKFEKVGNVDIRLKNGEKYDNEYLFGDFTKIFTPDKTNADIASQMDIIKSQLKGTDISPPKPVFIIGYGASGAGKTSSLIYFNKGKTDDERNGILVQLCNQLGAEGSYTHIEVQYREFYDSGKDKNGKDRNFTENPIYTDCKPAEFEYKEGFILSKQYCHANHHTYRIHKESPENTGKSCESSEETDCDTESITTFNEGDSVGKVMIHLIDKDRHVKATTNNPNSSRSHSLVFVKLMKKTGENIEKTGFLIVGDFAGVENVFDCENPSVLNQFMNIKEDKPGSKKLFYEEEKCGDVLDPIGSNANTCINEPKQNGGAGDSDDIISQKLVLPIYDFTAPELSQDFKTQYPILQEFKNTDNLKKSISIVREGVLGIEGKEIERLPDNRLNTVYNYDTFNKYKGIWEVLKNMHDKVKSKADNRDVHKAKAEEDIKALKNYNEVVNRLESNKPGPKDITELAFWELVDRAIPKENIYRKNIIVFAKRRNDLGGLIKKINYESNRQKLLDNLIKLFTINFPKPHINEDYKNAVDDMCTVYSSLKKTVDPLLKIVYKHLKFNYNLIDCKGTESVDKLVPTIKPEIIEMLDIVFKEDFYQFIKSMERDRTQRLALSEEVCGNRRTEGYFINDSLKQIRNVIREMLYVKNEGALEVMPNYIDICFDQYCPSHENCFSTSLTNNKKLHDPKSVIFDSIYKYLDENQYLQAIDDIQDEMTIENEEDNIFHDTEYSEKEKKQRMMYRDLLVCVFCVFNISKRANNPPPVPYVDINKLKKILYFGNIFEEDKHEFAIEANNLVQIIKNKYKYTIDTGAERNRLDGLHSLPLETNNKLVSSFFDNNNKSLPETITSFDLFEFITNIFQKKVPEADISIEINSTSKEKLSDIPSEYQPVISAIDNLLNLMKAEKIRVEFIRDNLGKDNKNYQTILNEFGKFSYSPDAKNAKDKYYLLRNEIRGRTNNALIEYKTILPDEMTEKFYRSFENHDKFNSSRPKEIDNYLNDIDNFINNITDKKKSIFDDVRHQRQQDKAKEGHNRLMQTMNKMNELNKIKENNYITMSASGFREYTKSYLLDFLTKVDNNNAISAIGTIEFIDKLSKLNSVATICNGDELDNTTIENYKKEFNFKSLYSPSIGGKNTRRRKDKKQGTRRLHKK